MQSSTLVVAALYSIAPYRYLLVVQLVRISKFHNANISNGMSPSIFINLPNGEPSPDEKRKLYNDLVNSFTGETNAGRIFLTFSEGNDLAPQVQTVPSANDAYYVVLEQRITSRSSA